MGTALRAWPLRMASVAMAAGLAGCATTTTTAQWRDPAFSPQALAGARVLVACRAPDEALRRGCEDRWTVLLGARDVVPVPSYTVAGFPA